MKNETYQINSCEVCGNQKLTSVLNLGFHPLCDDLVPINDSRTCKEYPIEILYCQTCRTAHHKFQVPKQDLFPKSYHYRSRFTADVLTGMSQLTDSCEKRFGTLKEKKILDIGCNDGSLLDFFKKKGAATFGIEPTGAYEDALQKGHLILNEFLSEEVAVSFASKYGKPDFITFTNVFAHIENLPEVLRSLKKLMTPSTVVVIENHYLGSVLKSNQFDTFYHEHPRSYSYTSFTYMAKSLEVDLLDVEFPSRYGGNIRVFMGTKSSDREEKQTDLQALDLQEGKFLQMFLSLSEKVESWRKTKKDQLLQLAKQHGKLRAKAFPGRAAILIKLLGLNEETISAVYEKPGSLKIGNYVPGTRIPILSDDSLLALPDQTLPIINLAWHIPKEIRNYLSQIGYLGPVIDVLESDKFNTN